MLRNRGISVVIVLGVTGLLMLPAPAAHAASEGAACSEVGKTIAVKSALFRCLSISGQRAWIRQPQLPATRGAAASLLDSWVASGKPEWLAAAQESASPSAQARASELLTLAQQDRDAKTVAANDAANLAAAMKSELDGLPGRISSAQSAIKPAEDALQQPKAEMNAAGAVVDSLSASYQVALTNKYADVACRITEMFGRGACMGLSSRDTWSGTISQYNAAKAKYDAAITKYNSYYAAYKAKFDAHKALYDRQSGLSGEYNSMVPQVQAVKDAAEASEGVLSTAHERIAGITRLQSSLAQLAVSDQALQQAHSPLLGPQKKWAEAFNKASLVAAKHRVYLQRVQNDYAFVASLG